MKIKFEKSKYPVFKISFWIIFVCSIFLILNIIRLNKYYFKIYSQRTIYPITVNLSSTRPINKTLFFCFNDYCKSPQNSSVFPGASGTYSVYSTSYSEDDEGFFSSKIEKISFSYPKEHENILKSIERIDFYTKNKVYSYSYDDIKNIKAKEVLIDIKKEGEKPYNLVTFKELNNYPEILKTFIILYLSLFFNWKFFVIPYAWLGIIFIWAILNKNEIKLNHKTIFVVFMSVIVLFGLCVFYIKFDPGNKSINEYESFIELDSKNHKDCLIYALTVNKNKPKGKNVIWHYVDLKDKKPMEKIKGDFIEKNKKAVLYFNDSIVDVTMASIFNPKIKIYPAANSINAKIIYE